MRIRCLFHSFLFTLSFEDESLIDTSEGITVTPRSCNWSLFSAKLQAVFVPESVAFSPFPDVIPVKTKHFHYTLKYRIFAIIFPYNLQRDRDLADTDAHILDHFLCRATRRLYKQTVLWVIGVISCSPPACAVRITRLCEASRNVPAVNWRFAYNRATWHWTCIATPSRVSDDNESFINQDGWAESTAIFTPRARRTELIV